MFKCFERFRRSLRDPEILTFDELYARAVMSLALADESASPAEASDPGEDTRTTTWTDYDSGEPF
jgi:hypothetical protein